MATSLAYAWNMSQILNQEMQMNIQPEQND